VDDAYDLGVVSGVPAWREVASLVTWELGEPVDDVEPLTPVRLSRMTWAAQARAAGAIVVKVRESDDGRADQKTCWCAAHLPVLGARGYPVPAILWHGPLGDGWQVTVESRLPGRPVTALTGSVLADVLSLAARIAGDDGLRCLVSYRAIAGLAHLTREWQSYGRSLADTSCTEISAILDRLQTEPGLVGRAAFPS
jgi:hypothetical protein